MYRNKAIFIVFVVTGIVLNSCSIQGLTSGYKNLNNTQKAQIQDAADFNLKQLQKGSYYDISGSHLKYYASQDTAAVVVIWTPHCTGKYCLSPNQIKKSLEGRGAVYVVADAYEMEEIAKAPIDELPVFFINARHYKSNLRLKYRVRFLQDLIGTSNWNDTMSYQSVFFFKNGQVAETRTHI